MTASLTGTADQTMWRVARQLEPAPRVTIRSSIFLPGGSAFARTTEALVPGTLPWGAFLAVVLRKPDITK